jgi:hypothetical protein
MSDTTPWIDPELVAAGKLLREKGLVAPDRTVASLADVRAATNLIDRYPAEGSVPLQSERDLSPPGPHGWCRRQYCRTASSGAVVPGAQWRRLHAGQPEQLTISRAIWCGRAASRLSVDYQPSPEVKLGRFRRDGRDDAPRRA